MILLLVRHGNTFRSGQTPYYVGGLTDLPLTGAGLEQAQALADALKEHQIRPVKVVCGPLKRTVSHAQVITETLGLARAVRDERLREMNYGRWEGKTNGQVDDMYAGSEVRMAWDTQGIVPKDAGFSPSPEQMTANVRALALEGSVSRAAYDIVLLCSSNGLLRYFLKLVPGAYEEALEKSQFKVATGNVCALFVGPDQGANRVLFWNQKPGALPFDTLKLHA